MAIQWFPGHMHTAYRAVFDALVQVDVLVELVDARIPGASRNPLIAQLSEIRQKPRLTVLNKADLAQPSITQQWLAYFNQQVNTFALALNAKQKKQSAQVIVAARKLAPHRNDETKPLRLMVVGIPNVGKSTLMNQWFAKRIAKAADEPAITKRLQRQVLSKRVIVIDTPGLLWPKITYATDGLMLAVCKSVGVNAYRASEVADFLAKFLLGHHPQALNERYGFVGEKHSVTDEATLLNWIAQRRHCFSGSRGEQKVDFEKAADILLGDFRQAQLGRISLETPQSRSTMLETGCG